MGRSRVLLCGGSGGCGQTFKCRALRRDHVSVCPGPPRPPPLPDPCPAMVCIYLHLILGMKYLWKSNLSLIIFREAILKKNFLWTLPELALKTNPSPYSPYSPLKWSHPEIIVHFYFNQMALTPLLFLNDFKELFKPPILYRGKFIKIFRFWWFCPIFLEPVHEKPNKTS